MLAPSYTVCDVLAHLPQVSIVQRRRLVAVRDMARDEAIGQVARERCLAFGWEEKAQAMSQLCPITALCPRPGKWVVSINCVERGDMSFLHGGFAVGGTFPEAVEHWWDEFVSSLGDEGYLVVHAEDSAKRRAVRWCGDQWVDTPETETQMAEKQNLTEPAAV
jgi:hypothetical protein